MKHASKRAGVILVVVIVAAAVAIWRWLPGDAKPPTPVDASRELDAGVGLTLRGGYGVLTDKRTGEIVLFTVAPLSRESRHQMEMQLSAPDDLIDTSQTTVDVSVSGGGEAKWSMTGNVVEIRPDGVTVETPAPEQFPPTLQAERGCDRGLVEKEHTQPLSHLLSLQRGLKVDTSVLSWGVLNEIVTAQVRLGPGQVTVPAVGNCWSVWQENKEVVPKRRFPSSLQWRGPGGAKFVDFVVVEGREKGKRLRLNASPNWKQVYLTGPEHVAQPGETADALAALQAVLIDGKKSPPWLPRCAESEESVVCDGRFTSPGPACPASRFEFP